MNFIDLGLSEKTIKAINEAGITEPTTVQADVIPSVLAGKDVFAIAPMKCGKTCSYVFPLIEIMAQHKAKNILIITSGAQQSVTVSDRFAVFNKYHEISAENVDEADEVLNNEANVVIASPKLLSDLLDEDKIDLSQTDILVVDDINLIKKTHQLEKLEKILSILPAEKQNIVFTNRRSKETQSILDKILQTPEEIKINKDKEQEAIQEDGAPQDETEFMKGKSSAADQVSTQEDISASENTSKQGGKKSGQAAAKNDTAKNNADKDKKPVNKKNLQKREFSKDAEALNLVKKYHTFGRNTPAFLLTPTELAEGD